MVVWSHCLLVNQVGRSAATNKEAKRVGGEPQYGRTKPEKRTKGHPSKKRYRGSAPAIRDTKKTGQIKKSVATKQYNICRSEAENVALVPKVMEFEVVTRSDKSEENEMVLLSLAAAALANASSSRRL